MGGHACGQEAAHLAIQALLECVLPMIENTAIPHRERLLVNGIQQANRVIYLRNQSREQQAVVSGAPVNTSQIRHMGTTITAALITDRTAYVANVGDSRTYLYSRSLRRITKDHSLVERLVTDGILDEEDVYVHPQRNQITRALGTHPSVEVDTFVVPLLHEDEILLLCSDGLWEMTRDHKIEEILASPWANASSMADQLVQLANDGGGADNIGCIIVQMHRRADICAMETITFDSSKVLTQPGAPSSWSA
jgi:serine/threonine protein phosphatase PrpC